MQILANKETNITYGGVCCFGVIPGAVSIGPEPVVLPGVNDINECIRKICTGYSTLLNPIVAVFVSDASNKIATVTPCNNKPETTNAIPHIMQLIGKYSK